MTSPHLFSWDKNDLRPITLQDRDKTVTFLNVLVHLVDKRVQLLPLLGGKLQCIAGMNPLTQGTAIQQRNRGANREDQLKRIKTQSWAEGQERRGLTSCRCPGRWFPQEQTGRGNLLGQTTAIQSYLYWSMSCDPFHSQVRGQGELQHHHGNIHFFSYWMSAQEQFSECEISSNILARFLTRGKLHIYIQRDLKQQRNNK